MCAFKSSGHFNSSLSDTVRHSNNYIGKSTKKPIFQILPKPILCHQIIPKKSQNSLNANTEKRDFAAKALI